MSNDIKEPIKEPKTTTVRSLNKLSQTSEEDSVTLKIIFTLKENHISLNLHLILEGE